LSRDILSVGINGASGRMGTRLIQLVVEDHELKLAAALERSGHPHLGADAGPLSGIAPVGVVLSDSLADDFKIDVLIDFSLPPASLEIAARCADRGIPLVVGTTGFDPAQLRILESAATRIPLLVSPNMSRAVNLLMRLVGEAARSVGTMTDIAIIERHHRTKVDAPSGTALRLAEIARTARASDRPSTTGPARPPARAQSDIDIHALRIGDSPGEHTVIFGFLGETLELSHRAFNRDGFARGAIEAAKCLAGKPIGLYSMNDVIA
jgi:4-hydroxy-tetrahydrodipicolinate reductase